MEVVEARGGSWVVSRALLCCFSGGEVVSSRSFLVAASAQPYSAPLQTVHTRRQLTGRHRTLPHPWAALVLFAQFVLFCANYLRVSICAA